MSTTIRLTSDLHMSAEPIGPITGPATVDSVAERVPATAEPIGPITGPATVDSVAERVPATAEPTPIIEQPAHPPTLPATGSDAVVSSLGLVAVLAGAALVRLARREAT